MPSYLHTCVDHDRYDNEDSHREVKLHLLQSIKITIVHTSIELKRNLDGDELIQCQRM